MTRENVAVSHLIDSRLDASAVQHSLDLLRAEIGHAYAPDQALVYQRLHSSPCLSQGRSQHRTCLFGAWPVAQDHHMIT